MDGFIFYIVIGAVAVNLLLTAVAAVAPSRFATAIGVRRS
jgi:hypothetical protein